MPYKNIEDKRAEGARYRERHRQRILEKQQTRRENNREEERRYNREYYRANREKLRGQKRDYCNNPINRTRRQNIRRTKKQGYLELALRHRLYSALKGENRAGSAVRDLGCSIAEFKAHIEAQFLPGMSWDNWGYRTWHLDHKRPLASFDLSDRQQFLVACHYTNYQPLWAVENMRKGARANAPK